MPGTRRSSCPETHEQHQLIGRLTREPDARTTANGTDVVTMRVAIDRPATAPTA